MQVPAQPVFYYDVGSPACYLVAEQVMTALPMVPEWEPVLAAELGLSTAPIDRSQIEREAARLGLQTVRWPARLPADSRQAMLAATYAKRAGRAVVYSLAAFRQAFAGGRDLGEESTVLIAAVAAEMHPTALLKALTLRSVGDRLTRAGQRARAAGVVALPAIEIDGQVFCGPDALTAAAAVPDAQR